MFRFFEGRVLPTATGMPGQPPGNLLRFYWFFLRQVRGYYIALLGAGLTVALLDALIPVFIGRVVTC